MGKLHTDYYKVIQAWMSIGTPLTKTEQMRRGFKLDPHPIIPFNLGRRPNSNKKRC